MPQKALNVVIRTDASVEIGIGHVMRCLTLAGELTRRGAVVQFLCRRDEGNLIDTVLHQGYRVLDLPVRIADEAQDARESGRLLAAGSSFDWIIVDQYSLGEQWEQVVRPMTKRLMVIDDLADRRHVCDLLLDQNFYCDADARYAGLLPASCTQLLGPAYTLLRPEFRETRERLRPRDGTVRRIMVFFGGSDRSNESTKVLNAIADAGASDIAVDVVIGVNNPHGAAIEEAAGRLSRASCHRRVKDMAALMAAADLYVGAAGSTTWERCCLGLPSLVVTVAENQVRPVLDLERNGVLRFIGRHDAVTCADITRALSETFNSPETLKHYVCRSMDLVDGLGVERCADAMGLKHLTE